MELWTFYCICLSVQPEGGIVNLGACLVSAMKQHFIRILTYIYKLILKGSDDGV
jgi:hypothetical protein